MKMHRNKSVMKHTFSQVPKVSISRSSFDRSHGHKTTMDASFLIPVYVDEALPGDTYNVSMTGFARLATPIFPIMDNMFLDTQFFAVPMRLVWDNWERFNGAQDNPGDSTSYLIPQVVSPAGGYLEGSVQDYMGIPTKVAGLETSALFNRGINLIWNQWYRDQNLQDSLPVPKGDGPDDPAIYTLLRRGKRHDYFTSCLPFAQKGQAVDIPLGLTAPIIGIGSSQSQFPTVDVSVLETQGIAKVYPNAVATNDAGGAIYIDGTGDGSGSRPNVYADLSAATAATINSLRQAFAVQQILEQDARGGTRYTEIIRSFFGVVSPDARLQRPEYLGGGSTPINISPIPQTSGTGAYTASPQGNLAAMGTALCNHGFQMSFTEHCMIIGFCSVRADLTYQQGLNRMFSRKTRYDFYLPPLAHIGEQAVTRKEIYATGVNANDDVVFGYQERYGEYRYKPSIITGLFRSNATGSLDTWHLSQNFATAPVLGEEFIVENPPIDRVIAVPSQPQFLFDTYFKIKCDRPMPVFGVPGLKRF
ncbi:MAG: major capsid protein [Microviridae sp.]|nr:MAG: major capsid protein [Microviridae sp.]